MMQEVLLSSICDLKNGFAFKSKDYVDSSNTLSCRMSSIRPGGNFDLEHNQRFLPDTYAEVYSDYLLNDGDIVIAMTDLAGDPKILGVPTIVNTGGKKLLQNQRVGKLVITDSSKVFIPYLQYALNRPSNKSYYKKFAGGGLQINVSKKDILNNSVPLPPLNQQKKIAAILDAADVYRQKTKALITKYDELTQSLFLKLFGDPVRNPKGWNVFSFKDVLEIRNGKNQKLIENKNGIYPICGSGGVMSYGDDYISEADSVIIGRKGNINKPILMKEKYWHVDTAFGLNPLRSVLEHDYLYWFCVRYNFEQHNKTVTIPSLTKETLMRIKIPIPHIDLQNQFADSVQAIEAQKAQAQASLAQADHLFNSLLQRAFKGELV